MKIQIPMDSEDHLMETQKEIWKEMEMVEGIDLVKKIHLDHQLDKGITAYLEEPGGGYAPLEDKDPEGGNQWLKHEGTFFGDISEEHIPLDMPSIFEYNLLTGQVHN
uniref:Uncharacterized protein n=1 Tax=Moniliophthora roreri TaxID=221103 RepID=A0A0W0GFB6_MONRR